MIILIQQHLLCLRFVAVFAVDCLDYQIFTAALRHIQLIAIDKGKVIIIRYAKHLVDIQKVREVFFITIEQRSLRIKDRETSVFSKIAKAIDLFIFSADHVYIFCRGIHVRRQKHMIVITVTRPKYK